MRRRLDLAASLIVAPPVLFLDEPTTGLDPRGRAGMWDVIAGPRRRRHDRPAHHAVPRRGRPACRPDRRRRPRPRHRARHLRRAEGAGGRRAPRSDRRPRRRRRRRRARAAAASPPASRAWTPSSAASSCPSPMARACSPTPCATSTPAGLKLDDLALRRPTLDDVFLTLTGHEAEEPTTRLRRIAQTASACRKGTA